MLQKNAKKENFRSFISWQKPVKVKTMQEKSDTCCKHSRSLPYYYWTVIAVLQDVQTE